jgi:hypothetical protein
MCDMGVNAGLAVHDPKAVISIRWFAVSAIPREFGVTDSACHSSWGFDDRNCPGRVKVGLMNMGFGEWGGTRKRLQYYFSYDGWRTDTDPEFYSGPPMVVDDGADPELTRVWPGNTEGSGAAGGRELHLPTVDYVARWDPMQGTVPHDCP